MGKFPDRPLFQMPAFSAGQRPPKPPKEPKPPKASKPPKGPKEQEPPRPTGQQDPAYNYYTCPKCRCALRVPKGKGKIQITCPKCGEKFLAQD